MISVVIPTHNRADLLERAVKSVLSQTYKEFEIIIVSDGSTDNTNEVVEKLKSVDERIRYISYHPGKGGNTARNIGIKAATYDYIAFLDDDDEWLPQKLEKQMDVLKANPQVGLIYTGVNIIYTEEDISYESQPSERGNLKRKILFKNYIGTTSTVVVQKKLFDKAGLFDINLKALQDYDLWIRLVQHTNVGVVSEPCINYYNYPGNKQISQQTEKYEDAIRYLEDKYSDLYLSLSNKENEIRKVNNYLLLANKAMRNNSKQMARKYSINSIKEYTTAKGLIFIFLSFLNYSTILRLRRIIRI